jgi:hypothetical protein
MSKFLLLKQFKYSKWSNLHDLLININQINTIQYTPHKRIEIETGNSRFSIIKENETDKDFQEQYLKLCKEIQIIDLFPNLNPPRN